MKNVPSHWMFWSVPAAARGCEFWQPSRIPSWPERFSTPSACHPGLLPWLRLAATHTPNSPNSDGAPAAFANVCFQAGWFRPCSTNRPVQILVQPGQLLFRMPEIRFSRLRLPDLCRFPDLCP